MQRQKPRQIAYRLLAQRAPGTSYVETRLDAALGDLALPVRDRALVQELVYGVVRWQATLDWLIEQRTAGRRQRSELQTLLRLGLYQLFWLDRVPDHAAVNETVALAREMGCGAQAGFVNAVLRGYAREKDQTWRQIEALRRSDPAVGWSHPAWLVQRWTARWGAETVDALLAWNNHPARNFARLNELRADATQLSERWHREQVSARAEQWDWIPDAKVFELEQHPPLPELGSFRDGWFYVQDPSTLLAVHELDPQPGEAILDLCAAPGGKTTYIAQRLRNQGRIVAVDNAPKRLALLRDNCRRLGVTCVEAVGAANVEAAPSAAPQFDRVLVDAPCSNTGVLRRRVELRWRLGPIDLERLSATQNELLDRVASQVKPGGLIVYSTCSLEPEENHEVVGHFLANHAEFEQEQERELLPFREHVDGAYVARLRRS